MFIVEHYQDFSCKTAVVNAGTRGGGGGGNDIPQPKM